MDAKDGLINLWLVHILLKMAAYSFAADRQSRFEQGTQNDIVIYNSGAIRDFVNQYDNLRRETFEEIQDKLKLDLRRNCNNFNKYWFLAKDKFSSSPSTYRKSIQMSSGKDFPDECHVALICYTYGCTEDSIYSSFNADCRDVCGGNYPLYDLPNLSIFFLMRYVMENQAMDTLEQPQTLFRGTIGIPNLDAFADSKYVGFGQFSSMTTKTVVSEYFGNTVFQIKNINKYPTKLIKMSTHSFHPTEEEYLLSPFQLYRIQSITKNQGVNVVNIKIH